MTHKDQPTHTQPVTSLPDLWRGPEGERIAGVEAWAGQRDYFIEILLGHQYGPFPPAPAEAMGVEMLHEHQMRMVGEPMHRQYRVSGRIEGGFQFILDLIMPQMVGPRAVLLMGDGCWAYKSEALVSEAVRRGYIVAEFNRLELAADPCVVPISSGLYAAAPSTPLRAITAWAWGYHRAVDVLIGLPEVDGEKIMIAGHSRGGKATLLAGALDERIALTVANGSGCGGAAAYRGEAWGRETLGIITERFPQWFRADFSQWAGRESELPFDQHMLLALHAPRALLLTEALGDLWANPSGTYQSYRAAREIFSAFDAADQIGIVYRGGVHDHSYHDFLAALNFADWRLRGIPPSQSFHPDPGPFVGR